MPEEILSPLAMQALLRNRKRTMKHFYKANGSEGVFLDLPVDQAMADEKRMSYGPVIISTPALDRDKDRLEPTGIVLDNYQNNPVVFWDHGFSGEEYGSMPIAKSEDESGELAIFPSDEDVKAWAYFHGKTDLPTQVFSLLTVKALRAASVRPEPIVSKLIDTGDGEVGMWMQQWGLAEWSFCGIGVNQEALAKAVRDKRWEGERLAGPLLKSFSHLGIKQAKGIGMSFGKNNKCDDDMTKAEGMTTEDEDNFQDDTKQMEDEESQEAPAEQESEGGGDVPPEAEPEEEMKGEGQEMEDETSQMKYGAQVLSALKNGIKELVEGAKPSLGPLENEAVSKFASELVEDLEVKMQGIDGLYSEQYPDQPSVADEEGKQDEPTPDETEEAMKSFLRGGLLYRSQVKGFSLNLLKLSNAKNLTKSQRNTLETIAKGMKSIEEKARNQEQTSLEKELSELKKLQSQQLKKLQQLVPAERF